MRHLIKIQYRFTVELGLLLSLVIITCVITGFAFHRKPADLKSPSLEQPLDIVEITQQLSQPAFLPKRPAIPIATANETLIEEEFPDTEIEQPEIPPAPEIPEKIVTHEEPAIFIGWTEAPQLIGGTAFIRKNLRYPELARQAGIEGKVILSVVIDEQGVAENTMILSEDGNVGFGNAALEVAYKCRFTPAKQRDKAVRVKYTIPIFFKLR